MPASRWHQDVFHPPACACASRTHPKLPKWRFLILPLVGLPLLNPAVISRLANPAQSAGIGDRDSLLKVLADLQCQVIGQERRSRHDCSPTLRRGPPGMTSPFIFTIRRPPNPV